MLVAELLAHLQEMPPTACVVSVVPTIADTAVDVDGVVYDHGLVRVLFEPPPQRQRELPFVPFNQADSPVDHPLPDEEDAARLERIGAMQRDLSFLFKVNWCDVDRGLQMRVLKHALTVLRGEGDD